jgi:cobalamin synthase
LVSFAQKGNQYLLAAIQFFTRIPLPVATTAPDTVYSRPAVYKQHHFPHPVI